MKKIIIFFLSLTFIANNAFANNTKYIEQAVGPVGSCAKYFTGGLQRAPTASNLNCDFVLGKKNITGGAATALARGAGYVKLSYEYCPSLEDFRKPAGHIKLRCISSWGHLPLTTLTKGSKFRMSAIRGTYLRLRAHFAYDQFKYR